jgi:hypothetical protein
LNNLTLKNQIPTTNKTLPAYQNNRWAISKKEFPETNIKERATIRIIFTRSRSAKENKVIVSLLDKFIFGVERLRIKSSK